MDVKERKTKGILTVIIIGIIFYGYSILCFFKPAEEMSESERRPLAQRPDISQEDILSGEYMKDFEEYAVDQAPGRQLLRGTKVFYQTVVMRKLDNDGMYLSNGYISKLDYPLDNKSIEYATNRFGYVYDNYLADTDVSVYLSIIPDKNYYNEKILYPSYDYNELVVKMCESMEYVRYIDIMDKLTMEDYYQTDTHLRQERIIAASDHLGKKMGASIDTDFEEVLVTEAFRGVYYRQFGMPMKGEKMYYLTNKALQNCSVYDHENDRPISMYNLEAIGGADPYEMYLHGSLSLVTIENPRATTSKELVIFRDSFGSSFAPILATGYAKVTLVDIRYLPANMLGSFIDFDKQDVLFLYSTSVLNNSETLK